MRTRRPAQANTTVSSRYQTVIPSEIREKFQIREGTRIAWLDKGDSILVVPLPEKPWQSFRGAGRDTDYLAGLHEHRKQERANGNSVEMKRTEGDRP